MIYYKINVNWFGDLGYLVKSWIMVWIWRSVVVIGVYMIVICFVVWGFNLEEYISMNMSIFLLLGVIFSIFLVFWINFVYDRWWEGWK